MKCCSHLGTVNTARTERAFAYGFVAVSTLPPSHPVLAAGRRAGEIGARAPQSEQDDDHYLVEDHRHLT